jgi:heme-degrading monooxygenase HmoA
MVCALTVRKLKPGKFDEFRDVFMSGFDRESPPEGWVRFNMLRNAEDPDEVVSFGFFDGKVEQLRGSAGRQGYEDQMKKIAPYVDSVGTDGLYEVVEDLSAAPAA